MAERPQPSSGYEFERQAPSSGLGTTTFNFKGYQSFRKQSNLSKTPFLTGDGPPGSYEAVATTLQTPPGNVAVAMHRLRQRFRDLVRSEIAQTVSRPEDVNDEMRHLFA